MTEAEYIRLHYGTCSTMEENPRSCRCTLWKVGPEEQVECPNWTSVPDKSFEEMRQRISRERALKRP